MTHLRCMVSWRNISSKSNISWQRTHGHTIQDAESFFIRTDLETFSITSHAHLWILSNEWVPSEWESKQLIKASQ